MLQSVKPKRHYHVGVIAFPREVREVWLKKLEWTDGLKTTHTLQLPYDEFLRLLASCEMPVKSKRKLFQQLLGREPSANEARYLRGAQERVCEVCGYTQHYAVNPTGSVELDCACQVASHGAEPVV